MFTIDQIEEALALARNTADYSKYLQDLNKMGVIRYEVFVADGHTNYLGDKNYTEQSEVKYANLRVADTSDKDKFLFKLKLHKEGQTDYMTFCSDAAEAGIEKWTLDLRQLTCTYFDKQGHAIFIESISGS